MTDADFHDSLNIREQLARIDRELADAAHKRAQVGIGWLTAGAAIGGVLVTAVLAALRLANVIH
jgi:hypothetical protein